jgi:hypothetical protein
MSAPPPALLDAIGDIRDAIPCLRCWSTVVVAWSDERDELVIRHPAIHPMTAAEQYELGEFVLAELGRRVWLPDYGTDLPTNVVAL